MHAKPDLRVFLKWTIAGSGSVITDVIPLMNLDDFITVAQDVSLDESVTGLVELLRHWKTDSSDVSDLCNRVERYFGHSWISSAEVHNDLYRQWAHFKHKAVDTIAGQTMNERLYWFGLHEEFELRLTPDSRQEIYTKLLASA